MQGKQGKNVTMPITDKRLVHKLYENHFEINIKKTNSSANMDKRHTLM